LSRRLRHLRRSAFQDGDSVDCAFIPRRLPLLALSASLLLMIRPFLFSSGFFLNSSPFPCVFLFAGMLQRLDMTEYTRRHLTNCWRASLVRFFSFSPLLPFDVERFGADAPVLNPAFSSPLADSPSPAKRRTSSERCCRAFHHLLMFNLFPSPFRRSLTRKRPYRCTQKLTPLLRPSRASL
jgi:hypothetical protein